MILSEILTMIAKVFYCDFDNDFDWDVDCDFYFLLISRFFLYRHLFTVQITGYCLDCQ